MTPNTSTLLLFGLLAVAAVAHPTINAVYREDSKLYTVEDGPYGGEGGTQFSDGGLVHTEGNITAIRVQYDDYIYGVQVRYGETWADYHGKLDG